MNLILFYYTLLNLLASILAASVCLSVYLVTRRRQILFAALAFFFYFFDIALVFQDEYILNFAGGYAAEGALLLRSVASLITGAGFLSAFWLFICDFLHEHRRAMQVVPPLVFLAVSAATLLFIPEGDTQRFWFWQIRQLWMYFMLLFLALRYISAKDETQRLRMWRWRWLYLALWIISILILFEDALTFFVLPKDSIWLSSMPIIGERNIAENILLLVCEIASCRSAFRSLTLRFINPKTGDNKHLEKVVNDTLLVYAWRYGLSEREIEILRLILANNDNQNIASSLSLAASTVKAHVHNILKKTGCANRQELTQDFWKNS